MSLTPLRTLDHLTLASARLARATPALWEDFLKVVGQLSSEKAQACVLAFPDQLMNVQGKAQQLSELHGLFASAVAQANKLEANMKEKSHGRQ